MKTRFYKIKIKGEKPRYYKNLKLLCQIEKLQYRKVYYRVMEKKTPYTNDILKIKMCEFEDKTK